ncbi:MAG: M1 family metallopeptidase, partial [Chloroflexota bacterium]
MAERHPFNLPGDSPHYTPDRFFQAQHLRLELRLDFEQQALEGVATYRLAPIGQGSDWVTLDAAEMDIQEVLVQGGAEPGSWTHDRAKLRVALPTGRSGEALTLAIRYSCRPARGMYFLAPDAGYPDRPRQAWTQGQAEDGKYWVPCFDFPNQKMPTEMLATLPTSMLAVSNGALLSVEDAGEGWRTWHFVQDVPHPAYLITLAAGDFSQLDEEWDGLPVQYFVRPGREEDGRRAFGNTPRMIDFFSSATGVRYPYAKYAQVAVADFIYGGMENTSATTQTDRTL